LTCKPWKWRQRPAKSGCGRSTRGGAPRCAAAAGEVARAERMLDRQRCPANRALVPKMPSIRDECFGPSAPGARGCTPSAGAVRGRQRRGEIIRTLLLRRGAGHERGGTDGSAFSIGGGVSGSAAFALAAPHRRAPTRAGATARQGFRARRGASGAPRRRARWRGRSACSIGGGASGSAARAACRRDLARSRSATGEVARTERMLDWRRRRARPHRRAVSAGASGDTAPDVGGEESS